MLNLRRLAAVALLAIVATAAGCVHPLPNPGQVVLSCGLDAVKDPAIRQKVLDALAQPNFEAAVFALIDPALGITEAVVICIAKSYLGQLAADPASAKTHDHARRYLERRGVQP